MARILFCEDEPRIQRLFAAAWQATDHEIIIASNGLEGLALAEKVLPDLIVTDLVMPELDGDSLADAVRANPRLRGIPVVLLTASSRRKHSTIRSDRYLAELRKPFSPSQLRREIEQLLKNESASPPEAIA